MYLFTHYSPFAFSPIHFHKVIIPIYLLIYFLCICALLCTLGSVIHLSAVGQEWVKQEETNRRFLRQLWAHYEYNHDSSFGYQFT